MFVSNGAMESLRIPCQGRAESGGNAHYDSCPFPDLTTPLLYVANVGAQPRGPTRDPRAASYDGPRRWAR
jgi:hypothetical protein